MNKEFNEKELYENYINNFPFLTIGEFDDEIILGIIQNIKENYIFIYVFNIIKTEFLRRKFLELGNKWWWESNRSIPINIFLNKEFDIFKNCLRIYQVKNFKILYTPNINNSKSKKHRKINLLLSNN